jgi:hypothetical protein
VAQRVFKTRTVVQPTARSVRLRRRSVRVVAPDCSRLSRLRRPFGVGTHGRRDRTEEPWRLRGAGWSGSSRRRPSLRCSFRRRRRVDGCTRREPPTWRSCPCRRRSLGVLPRPCRSHEPPAVAAPGPGDRVVPRGARGGMHSGRRTTRRFPRRSYARSAPAAAPRSRRSTWTASAKASGQRSFDPTEGRGPPRSSRFRVASQQTSSSPTATRHSSRRRSCRPSPGRWRPDWTQASPARQNALACASVLSPERHTGSSTLLRSRSSGRIPREGLVACRRQPPRPHRRKRERVGRNRDRVAVPPVPDDRRSPAHVEKRGATPAVEYVLIRMQDRDRVHSHLLPSAADQVLLVMTSTKGSLTTSDRRAYCSDCISSIAARPSSCTRRRRSSGES